MLKIADYTQIIEQLKTKIKEQEIELPENLDEHPIRIVFVGQYSAGKSTIMQMLTGNEDITIGESITTQKTASFKWNGIEIIDTPGIHTELRPDHDEISYEAIASADMLVYVITNELFDDHIGANFRKLAIDKDKAGEMILVVNKMNRAANGNTPKQQEIIKNDLNEKNVLTPYTPEQLHISFLDAESYVDSLPERDEDPELADELLERSGYTEFINTLNEFVKEKGMSSKLTTQLYIIDKKLEDEIEQLQPKSEDDDINALEENLIQQKYILVDARGRIYQEAKDISIKSASQIREIGLNAANLITEDCKQEEVERELENYTREVENISEKCQIEIQTIVNERLHEINKQLDDLENSTFSIELKTRLTKKYNKLPESVKKIFKGSGDSMQRVGKAIVNNSYKTGVNSGLKLTNFSGGKVHELVLKVGEKINFKFKPWQAIKIAKGIAILGNVLNALGIGLELFLQLQSDNKEDKLKKELRKNREIIRSQFNTVANSLEDYTSSYITKNVCESLEESINELDKNIQEIRDTRSTRSNRCKELENIQKECRELIADIHANN